MGWIADVPRARKRNRLLCPARPDDGLPRADRERSHLPRASRKLREGHWRRLLFHAEPKGPWLSRERGGRQIRAGLPAGAERGAQRGRSLTHPRKIVAGPPPRLRASLRYYVFPPRRTESTPAGRRP